MTENIAYKRYTCDFCKKEEHINLALILPKTWGVVEIKPVKLDCCKECKNAIEDILGEMIKRNITPEAAYKKLFGGTQNDS